MQTDVSRQVGARTLKQWLHDGQEIALLDVREAGQFGEGHLFLAVPLPYSRLELDIERLVPRKSVRIVLIDDDGCGPCVLSLHRLAELGYENVFLLEDGMQGWRFAGLEVFAGVNVPSKAFGELAEHEFKTPHISASELDQKLREGQSVVVLDGRPFAEYQKMSIPQATCCPNGELALRVDDLVKDSDTTIVVNCAGRTRSIIGAQTLINLGIKNPVLALENGTQGWFLSDLVLDHGESRRYSELDKEADIRARVERASRLADRFGIRRIDATTLQQWRSDTQRTTFVCDVRTPDESQARPIAGAQPSPGGQLIQATDQYIGIRGARIVLVDDDNVRAPVVATWLYMLGWDVAVLPADQIPQLENVSTVAAQSCADDACEQVAIDAVKTLVADGALLLDVRPSMQFRRAHIAQARWMIRPNLCDLNDSEAKMPDTVVLIGDDKSVTNLVARDLRTLGVRNVYCCLDSQQAWVKAGLEVLATPDSPPDAQCIDFLFFVHDRHDGNKQAARQYLAWETNLLAQMDDAEKAMYRFAPQSA